MKKRKLSIVVDPVRIGRIPLGDRASQVFRPKKGRGSYRRSASRKWQGWEEQEGKRP